MMITTTLMLAASLAISAPEAELDAKLPEIFARSAEHYKALDAAARPRRLEKKDAVLFPAGFRRATNELDMRPVFWWTSGHFAGTLWYLYEATGDAAIRDDAAFWMADLAPNAKVTSNHDVGFIMYCSYGNARRILKTKDYDAILVETAQSLGQRFSDQLGLIRSWGKKDDTKTFKVIPDNMMNLELLEAVGQMPRLGSSALTAPEGDRFKAMAESHADMTMKHHFRADYGCYHVLNYDQTTGRILDISRGQGASVETAWSRGQSWAIYGYTMMYRFTHYTRYLEFARKLADFAMNNPNMPADGVPYWDYGAPGEERDSSAASIMASGLLELSQYVDGSDRARYRAFAVKQLLSLSSPAYFSKGNEIGHFLLKHGVGHKPGNSEIDTPLVYGDYYYVEALLRYRKLRASEKSASSNAQ